MKQDYSYWNSKESIDSYTKDTGLFDVEKNLIMDAVKILGKKVADIKILDIGCGGGRTTKVLYQMGFQVKAIDIADQLVEALKKELPDVPVLCGSASDMPYKNSMFDIVLFSHNSIDYLEPYSLRRKTYQEIFRVLKKRGIFIFSSHEFQYIPYNLSVAKNILINILHIHKLKRKGYFIEQMSNGQRVNTYTASEQEVRDELKHVNFVLKKSIKNVAEEESQFKKYLLAKIGWERYYLAEKYA